MTCHSNNSGGCRSIFGVIVAPRRLTEYRSLIFEIPPHGNKTREASDKDAEEYLVSDKNKDIRKKITENIKTLYRCPEERRDRIYNRSGNNNACDRGNNSGDNSFHDIGAANQAVRRPNRAHNADLVAVRIDRKAYCIKNHQPRDKRHNKGERKPAAIHVVDNIAQNIDHLLVFGVAHLVDKRGKV